MSQWTWKKGVAFYANQITTTCKEITRKKLTDFVFNEGNQVQYYFLSTFFSREKNKKRYFSNAQDTKRI